MNADAFLQGMERIGVDFFTGVPDSLLKPLNDALYASYGCTGRHVVAANEGGAAALAAGHYIATGRPGLCYMQNSGLGTAVNPVASLLNGGVYGIPCVFVVGWRGEPGTEDEPQHAFQGAITQEMLSLLQLTPFLLDKQTDAAAFEAMLSQAAPLLAAGNSVAFLVRKGGLTGGPAASYPSGHRAKREDVLRAILQTATSQDIFVATTGKTSREVFEIRQELGQDHSHDFLTVGSMGHAGMIALGIAMAKPEYTVWLLDGDGAALMHLGSLLIESQQHASNLIHVLLNNGAHESVGGMPVAGGHFWFSQIARAIGYSQCFTAESVPELKPQLAALRKAPPGAKRFVEIMLQQGSRQDLGRPTLTPKQNLQGLMRTLDSAPEAGGGA